MSAPNQTTPGWKAATRKLCITPKEPIHLHGFGDRPDPTSEVLQDIYARTLALQDEAGQRSVLLSTDLLGFTREMSETIAQGAQQRFGLPRERLVMNASHNHSGPATGDLLHLYFDLGEGDKAVIARYTDWLLEGLIQLIGDSLQELQPVELSFGLGLTGFGTNRRRSVPGRKHWATVVDHDVPVLAARTPAGDLLAVVFGYACHTTASHGDQIHGDYAGFAQVELEEALPGTTALFIAGCGGDINPLPRARPDAAQIYGGILASAVDVALKAPMKPLEGPLRAAFEEVAFTFQTPLTREELCALLPGTTSVRRRELEYALSVLERDGKYMDSAPFPMQVWKFGQDLTWIFLSGEPVVDYSLKFKARYGWETTWVSGYCNELLAYIPSLRVLREGGYEGTDGAMEYCLPAPFAEDIEEIITTGIERLELAARNQEQP